jgi:hypothetical protein
MSQRERDKQAGKAAMKKLREERKAFVKAASVKMKIQKKAIQAVKDQLREGAQTVPAIAAATGATTAETLWYVAALKKYGEIKEVEKDGGYFNYELINTVETAEPAE